MLIDDVAACGGDGSGLDAPATESTTGGPTESQTDGDTPDIVCALTPTVLTDVESVAITGRSAVDILAEVEGSYNGTLTWTPDGWPTYLGSTEPAPVTVTITYAGGELRSIDAEMVGQCPSFAGCYCEDMFEIDVTWRLTTADGVLDETWTAPIQHDPNSYTMVRPLGIRGASTIDELGGSLWAGSFELPPDIELREVSAQAELGSGIAIGSIFIETASMGAVGFGLIADFIAARAIDDIACNAIEGAAACAGVGCTPVVGQRLHGFAPQCECAEPESFCFAVAPADDAPLGLYTRVVSDDGEASDEIVALPMLGDPPPAPWRACADALDVDGCACVDDESLCE